MDTPDNMSLGDLASHIRARRFSTLEVVNFCLERIDATAELNAWVTLDPDQVRACPRTPDPSTLSAGDARPVCLAEVVLSPGATGTAPLGLS